MPFLNTPSATARSERARGTHVARPRQDGANLFLTTRGADH
jgi:hypothetical protein